MQIPKRLKVVVDPELLRQVVSDVRTIRKNIVPIQAGLAELQKAVHQILSSLEEIDSRSRMLRTFGDESQAEHLTENFKELQKRLLSVLPLTLTQLYPYVVSQPKGSCNALGLSVEELVNSLQPKTKTKNSPTEMPEEMLDSEDLESPPPQNI